MKRLKSKASFIKNMSIPINCVTTTQKLRSRVKRPFNNAFECDTNAEQIDSELKNIGSAFEKNATNKETVTRDVYGNISSLAGWAKVKKKEWFEILDREPPKTASKLIARSSNMDNKEQFKNLFLNLDNTNFSSLEIYSILTSYYKPEQGHTISTSIFSGQRDIKALGEKFGTELSKIFNVRNVYSNTGKFTYVGDDMICIIQRSDSYSESNSRTKEFLEYSMLIIGTLENITAVENLIPRVEYTKVNAYFKLESYFHAKAHDEVLYNEIHIDKKKYQDILVGLHPKIDTHDLITSYMNSNENILILFGEPGTGKTTLIKQMMLQLVEDHNENPIIIYTKDINVLKKEVFWNMILEREPHLLILDDLDSELSPREMTAGEEENNSLVNKLLSVSDGIFHSKTKIVITTNMNHDTIDPAIIRPGRCFDILNIPPLEKEEAKNIWINLLKHTEAEFDEIFDGIPSIKQAYLMSEHEKMKVSSKSYLKAPEISVRDSYIGRKKRSIGFH